MTPVLIEIFTYLLLVIAIIYFFRRNDEFVILLIFFFISTGISRYNSVLEGKAKWAMVAYAQNIFDMTNDIAVDALNYFFLGTFIFSFAYLVLGGSQIKAKDKFDKQDLLVEFINKNQLIIIVTFIFFTMLNALFNQVLSGEKSLAYGLSYFYLFKLAIGGLILLLYLLFKYSYNPTYKTIYLLLLGLAAFSSYNPILRFQFISWMAALGMMIVRDMNPLRKSFIYFFGGFILIIAFAMAGNERYGFVRKADFEKKVDYAIRRLSKNEDQNMLDGFMMVLQVYPKYLEFGLGSEHFEILLRPIPRKLWPEKPVGGYANKLGLNSIMKGQTVGISQSIYGTFYGEGGVMGIILFSVLYGFVFVRLFQYANQYTSELKYILKGLIFASAIPLLRGGDLPGIIAFIGMSYWPVFIFIYRYNKFLRQKEKEVEEKFIAKSTQPKPTFVSLPF